MIPHTLTLGIIATPVKDPQTGEQVWWHRCHLDFPDTKKIPGPRFITFRWWRDRDGCIREAREFCEHLDIQIEETF